MRILTPFDGPGVGVSTLVRRSAYGGASPYPGDSIDRGDTGNPASSPGADANPFWIDRVPRPQRCPFSWDTESVDQDWTTNNSGAGSDAAITGDPVHQNLRSLNTGTATSGRGSRGNTIGVAWVIFSSISAIQQYHAKFRIPTLTDGTDTFGVSFGFHDLNTADDAVDGAYLRLASGDSGVMQAVTSSNSTRTTTTTGITISAATWYFAEIIVTQDSSADFFLWQEGSARPTSPTVNIATNIPSGATRGTAVRAGIIKTAGTNSRSMEVAYQLYFMDRTAL